MGWARKKLRQLDKAIIRPVLNTVEGIIEDPKKLAMVALSVFAPGVGSAIGGAMGLSGTAAAIVGNTAVNTVLNGGDIKSAIIAAAIPVVGKEMAGIAANSFVEAGMDKALAETAGNVTSRSLLSAAQGKDPINALVTGGLSAGTDAVLKEIPGFNDLDPSLRKMATKAVTNTLAGNAALSPQDAINAALNIGMKAVDRSTDEEGNLIEGYFKPGGAGYIPPEELEATVKPDADAESAFLRQMNPYLAQQQDAEKTNFKEPESSITEPTEVGQIPFDPVSLLTELPTETPPVAPPVETPVEPQVPTPSGGSDSPATSSTRGYIDEITGKFIPDENGGLQGPLGPETGNIDPNKQWEYDLVRPGVWANKDGEEIDVSYMPDRDTAQTGGDIMRNAGVVPGGSKAPTKGSATPAKPATPGAAPTTSGAKTPATGTNPAVDAITNLVNQQQNQQNALLNMMASDKAGVANIKSFKDLYGDSLFGGSYVPPSALGASDGFSGMPIQMPDTGQNVGDDGFSNGGHVDDFSVDALLQILRG